MTDFWYHGERPDDKARIWTRAFQGLTHNFDHWIVANHTRIYKFHISQDLGVVDGTDAVSLTRVPTELADMGHDHFCDMDYVAHERGGFLFVPMHGHKTDASPHPYVVAMFEDDGGSGSFRYLGFDTVPFKPGWCAISPRNFMLCMSHNKIPKTAPFIRRFGIDWSRLLAGSVRPGSTLVAKPAMRLSDVDGDPVSMGQWLQGGTFFPDGSLALLSGALFKRNADRGIRVFDSSGTLRRKSTVTRPDKPGRLFYEFHPMQGQEPEGLTYWDTRCMPEANQTTVGQFHAGLLNKRANGRDSLWLKHYSIAPLPTPTNKSNYQGGVLRLSWRDDPARPKPGEAPTSPAVLAGRARSGP